MNRQCRKTAWMVLLGLVLACAQPALAGPHASTAQGYRLQQRTQVKDAGGDLTGLAYDAHSGHLLAVVRNPQALLVLAADGRVLRRIKLVGFRDIEAVAALPDGSVVVVDRVWPRAEIFRMPPPGTDFVNEVGTRKVRLDGDGLAYDPSSRCLWTVRQRWPGMSRGLSSLCNVTQWNALQTTNRGSWLSGAKAGNRLTGIAFDPKSRRLLLMSRESARVTEMDLHGHVTGHFDLGGRAGEPRPPRAEGIAVDGLGHLYIVSEPDLFYRYARK